ncbi:DUF5694 domain-containing protein [Enterovirga sp. GCM10030262]|uniref:DUF5694 domain-containing protein n=1 Tax=Enterovirga sp. GCM10030262 TaxID=3273391 RepID=UPI00362113BB
MKLVAAAAAAALIAGAGTASARQPFGILGDRAPDARPAMLVLGTPHFDNPGRDIVNQKIEDVLTPGRQREIEAIVERLAAFRPTHVAVEWRSSRQEKLDQRYADYRAGRYQLSRDERDQIGLRLAARLGLDRVHAVDWNEMPPGEEADYDFLAYAQQNGLAESFDKARAAKQAQANRETGRMRCTNVAAWLRNLNTPEARRESHRAYYDIALVGDAQTNPGANWVGSWYGRNLKIFANLVRLADRPEDRVVVIYGAGHGPLLAQFAEESGAFEVVDPLANLPEAAARPACPNGDAQDS